MTKLNANRTGSTVETRIEGKRQVEQRGKARGMAKKNKKESPRREILYLDPVNYTESYSGKQEKNWEKKAFLG